MTGATWTALRVGKQCMRQLHICPYCPQHRVEMDCLLLWDYPRWPTEKGEWMLYQRAAAVLPAPGPMGHRLICLCHTILGNRGRG